MVNKYIKIELFIFCFCIYSCKSFVNVDAPYTSLNLDNVYSNDATAAGVLTGIYGQISSDNIAYSLTVSLTNIPFYTGLSSDELSLFHTGNVNLMAYYSNALTNNSITNDTHWETLYRNIFYSNSAIEGLTDNKIISANVDKQLLGEAKFIRAYCYFYLVNLFGDVPLALTTNPNINSVLSKSNSLDVYKQIERDLLDANLLLSESYLDATVKSNSEERVRPTKWAAAALLARVYLYMNEYQKAIDFSSIVIDNIGYYSLTDLNNVFLKNSSEAIWQLQPVGVGPDSNTGEGNIYILTKDNGLNTYDHTVYLSHHLIDSFEEGDNRRVSWIDSLDNSGKVYYFPYKYKIGAEDVPTSEYIMMLRLGEQYLIRSEAYASLGNISAAQTDLNIIRHRAGLENTNATSSQTLISAIAHERQVELFTESGHRWFDMKRMGTANNIMPLVTKEKGGNWNANWQLYPILSKELQFDPNLTQNPGY